MNKIRKIKSAKIDSLISVFLAIEENAEINDANFFDFKCAEDAEEIYDIQLCCVTRALLNECLEKTKNKKLLLAKMQKLLNITKGVNYNLCNYMSIQ